MFLKWKHIYLSINSFMATIPKTVELEKIYSDGLKLLRHIEQKIGRNLVPKNW